MLPSQQSLGYLVILIIRGLGPIGTALFIAAVVCHTVSIYHAARLRTEKAYLFLLVGWLSYGMLAMSASVSIQNAIQFAESGYNSPCTTPLLNIYHTWQAVALAFTAGTIVTIAIVIWGAIREFERPKRRILLATGLAAGLFACANVWALILMNRLSHCPAPRDRDREQMSARITELEQTIRAQNEPLGDSVTNVPSHQP